MIRQLHRTSPIDAVEVMSTMMSIKIKKTSVTAVGELEEFFNGRLSRNVHNQKRCAQLHNFPLKILQAD